ncbi:hypothetical protein GMOD_00006144 [Pyrenophora seminiperda CCB06]|uniref:Uncharacterized protein n=1 Tax=Pyrenophora seminiperda CCB06 TaxID=1302712 RepID=A0A3M7M4D1_9PLEO|nr:hypothetical protein GMOD_00006144 [Pyrenophora seminiperda CCB06]
MKKLPNTELPNAMVAEDTSTDFVVAEDQVVAFAFAAFGLSQTCNRYRYLWGARSRSVGMDKDLRHCRLYCKNSQRRKPTINNYSRIYGYTQHDKVTIAEVTTNPFLMSSAVLMPDGEGVAKNQIGQDEILDAHESAVIGSNRLYCDKTRDESLPSYGSEKRDYILSILAP